MEDLLVCGSCQRDFPLGNIVNFVQHKKFDCADVSIAALTCQSCPQQFGTPWSLMKHAQNVHALRIYLETGIREVNSYPGKWPVSPDISNSAVVDFSGVENISGKSSAEVVLSPPQQPGALSGAVTVMLENSLSSELQALPASNLAAAHNQFNNSELMQSSLCSNLSEDLENMSPKQYTEHKKLLSVDSNTSEHISGDLTLQTSMEEVDSVSGHSAVLQKCCSSVLPKKRKRHIEIKHSSGRKRLPMVSSSPTSIYIDLEPGPEASLSHDSLSDPITLRESESSEIHQLSLRRRSVIIQPGMTFSIPVSHASVSLAPSFSSPVVADSFTSLYDQKSTAEQCLSSSSMVDSVATDANTLTCQPVQEFALEQKSSADESSHDGLVGDEQGCAKTLEHKRRRYPTSRPFKCDQCDNAFNQRIHLKKHQSKHTGVKPFKCDQCDYSTVERSHLKVHIRVHTGEKPYKCTYCEYATAQNSTLKIHLRRHHHGPVGTESAQAAAAYVCSKCGVEFEERDMYQCHDAEQHTSRPTMQSSVSVSSERQDAAFTDNDDNTDNVDSRKF